MSKLFTENQGQVVGLKLGEGALPGSVVLHSGEGTGGDKFGAASDTLIITSVNLGLSVNHQFTRSLGSSIYLYVFGDDFGDLQVSGLAFSSGTKASDCGLGASTGQTGVDGVLEFYNKNKTSKIAGSKVPQVTLQIGEGNPFIGFLLGMKLDMSDPDKRISRFSFLIRTLPDVTALP